MLQVPPPGQEHLPPYEQRFRTVPAPYYFPESVLYRPVGDLDGVLRDASKKRRTLVEIWLYGLGEGNRDGGLRQAFQDGYYEPTRLFSVSGKKRKRGLASVAHYQGIVGEDLYLRNDQIYRLFDRITKKWFIFSVNSLESVRREVTKHLNREERRLRKKPKAERNYGLFPGYTEGFRGHSLTRRF